MADPCAECKHAKVPNAWGCAACGRIIEQPMLAENKKLRADLAAATNSREHFLSELLAEQEACKGWRLKYDAEQRAHAETRAVLDSEREGAQLALARVKEELVSVETRLALRRAERDRYEAELATARPVLAACDDLGQAQILDIHSVDRELGNLLLARLQAQREGGGQ